jgi:hypothetical protein
LTSAPLAARIIETFVDKQRRLNNNLEEAKVPSKVEVGAVWSQKPEGKATPDKTTTAAVKDPVPAMGGGHFTVPAQ